MNLKIREAAAPPSSPNSCSAQTWLSSPPHTQTKCQLQTEIWLKAAGRKLLVLHFCFSTQACTIHSTLNIHSPLNIHSRFRQQKPTCLLRAKRRLSAKSSQSPKSPEMLQSFLLPLNSQAPFFPPPFFHQKTKFRCEFPHQKLSA